MGVTFVVEFLIDNTGYLYGDTVEASTGVAVFMALKFKYASELALCRLVKVICLFS
ncbi:hypothetical protein TUM17377_30640 [Shewanella chilikensis]|jgi:hypothetical protein|nr:hypothetical protein TUM17377_30640 [Shewanella chilikensis]GHA95590.1 hypothetical protein GCM10007107_05780 [Shewanella indica]